MPEDLQAKISQLESQLAEARSVADRAISTARSAREYAEDRCNDQEQEIAYQRGRADEAVRRVEDAVLDIQGVNLEQRITNVLLSKIQDGTFTTVEVVAADTVPEQANWPATVPIPLSPFQTLFDSVYPNSGARVYNSNIDGGTHPVVQSGQDLSADSGTEYVADMLDSDGNVLATGTVSDGNFVPDDGAGLSETASPNEVEREDY